MTMLTVLRKIIQEVSQASDFNDALDLMVRHVAKALSTEACSIFLLDQDPKDYVLVATIGLNEKAIGKIRVPHNKGLLGLVGEREEPVNLDEATTHPAFYHVKEAKEDLFHAFLGVPIIYQRKLLGVLIVQQQLPRKYDESEEAFLVTLATQLAAIIAHAEAIGSLSFLSNKQKIVKNKEAVYAGVPCASGIAIGVGVVTFPPLDLDAVPHRLAENIEDEMALINAAFESVRADLRLLSERVLSTLPKEERALFDVYQHMLDSAELGAEMHEEIKKGEWAEGALRHVIQIHVRRLESLDNEYMRERAEDVKDLGRRVLAYLQKSHRDALSYLSNTILIGDVITPTQLAEVPEGCLAGIISQTGSRNSHIAILARAMKIPTVMGVRDVVIAELQDKDIVIDGFRGEIHVSPSRATQKAFEAIIQEEKALDAVLDDIRDMPSVTQDGHSVQLMVNAGLGADISISLAVGADGVGLYRTEVPFMMRDRFPSGEEQRIIYRQLLASFAPRPVTIRTLDVGGDKPLPYFPIKEDNPFLGWRGMRIMLDHPEIFLSQMRAMMRASDGIENMRIMLPMITDVTEVDEALRLINKAYAEVREEGINIEMPQIGVMVEVPSAVYQARALAKRVDFLSVGSNDLTQYILAVDRNNARVTNLYDSLHPAVLRSYIQVVESGHREGKHVSICGEIAGDPTAILLLMAIGFDSFSMNATSVARARWIVRNYTLKKASHLLQEILGMESAVVIRTHLEKALQEANLGHLIRARKS